jgi:hypothetical protein
MARYVVQVVKCEGPIHESEIATRIRSAWGLARTGSRIRDAVEAAIQSAKRTGRITGSSFYTLPNQKIQVRDRSNVNSPTLRKLDYLPPAEIECAIMSVIDTNFGAGRDELVVAVAREFGFTSTSTQLRSVIDGVIEELVRNSRLKVEGNQISAIQAFSAGK